MIIVSGKSGELGVDNVKRLFTILLQIYAKVKALVKDFDFPKLFSLAMQLAKYKDDLPVFKAAWSEFRDLKVDDGELEEITTHLQLEAQKVGIFSPEILMIIKESLDFVEEVFTLWKHAVSLYEKAGILFEKIRTIREADTLEAA